MLFMTLHKTYTRSREGVGCTPTRGVVRRHTTQSVCALGDTNAVLNRVATN